jgi:hypothetical protein
MWNCLYVVLPNYLRKLGGDVLWISKSLDELRWNTTRKSWVEHCVLLSKKAIASAQLELEKSKACLGEHDMQSDEMVRLMGYLCQSLDQASKSVGSLFDLAEKYFASCGGDVEQLKARKGEFMRGASYVSIRTEKLGRLHYGDRRGKSGIGEAMPGKKERAGMVGKSRVNIIVITRASLGEQVGFDLPVVTHINAPADGLSHVEGQTISQVSTVGHRIDLMLREGLVYQDDQRKAWCREMLKRLALVNADKVVLEELEEYVISIFFSVLEHHHYLLKSSAVTIYVRIVSLSEAKNALGAYFSSMSSPHSMYISLRVDHAMDSYLLNAGSVEKDEFYATIVHELTHAYDYYLNKVRQDAATVITSFIPSLDGDVGPAASYVCNAMFRTRVEGIARLNETLAKYARPDGIVFVIDEAFPGIDAVTREVRKIFNQGMTFYEGQASATDFEQKLLQYSYGSFCCFMILLARLLDYAEFYRYSGKEEFSHRLSTRIALDAIDLHKKNILVRIPPAAADTLKQALATLSFMNVEQFFSAYFKAMQSLKLSNGITLALLEEGCTEHLKQQHDLLVKLGFPQESAPKPGVLSVLKRALHRAFDLKNLQYQHA